MATVYTYENKNSTHITDMIAFWTERALLFGKGMELLGIGVCDQEGVDRMDGTYRT